MMHYRNCSFKPIVIVVAAAVLTCSYVNISHARNHQMIYSKGTPRHEPATKAAQKWDQAMPTGNGRVGALVFGNVENEQIILNHDSLFFTTKKPTLPDVSEHLTKVRKLAEEGKYKEAGEY